MERHAHTIPQGKLTAGADIPRVHVPDLPDIPLPNPSPAPPWPASAGGPLPALNEEEREGDWGSRGDGTCPLRCPQTPRHPERDPAGGGVVQRRGDGGPLSVTWK